jgi:1-hydroxycarotenoid 3,4-desaturase
MKTNRIIIVGAGAGGLAAAIDLARLGCDVTVLERQATPGGKMRHVHAGGSAIDAGPTVFTMRWIFDGLFNDAGTSLDAHLNLTSAGLLARHAWRAGGRLDLFADVEQSADAIADFAGAREAEGYRAFCNRSADIYRTLVAPFIAMERPSSPLDLTMRVGLRKLDALWRTAPLKTLWSAIGENFADPRLRQLFGRYATYVGSSPMLAPATLMLIAHVEQKGVWLVEGGMHAVAKAMQSVAESKGALFRFDADVARISSSNGRVDGVELTNGERLDADIVLFNGDHAALAELPIGKHLATGLTAPSREQRSLSALTWCINAPTSGFPLAYHNVFFAENYQAEFDAIFRDRAITAAPTVYICAQDRRDGTNVAAGRAERLLVLINAPADGDISGLPDKERADLARRTFALLSSCGLDIDMDQGSFVLTSPAEFHDLFPATGGGLYGRANHGTNATFERPGATTRVPGLYLAGGSVHPGAGVPMATMSGRLAAGRILEDLIAARDHRRPRLPVGIPADPNP